VPIGDSRMRRIGVPALGLALAAAAGWVTTMPGARNAPAHAVATITPPPLIRHTQQRHGGIPLETLRSADSRLDSVPVRNTHSDPIGFVRNVVAGRGGRPELVNVAFGGFLGFGEKVVPLEADTLGYDPLRNVVLTDMTLKELEVIAQQRQARAD